jgi:hypothetical protein
MILGYQFRNCSYKHREYPVRLELSYKLFSRRVLLEAGRGCTVTISSRKIVFESDRPLQSGVKVELFIDWPARLANDVCLRLHVAGRTGEPDKGLSVVDIERHEFRVRSDRPGLQAEDPRCEERAFTRNCA